ncbi:hypothetical protein KIW84_031985 [Lathyrus oleraceus]|uniref:Amino acid transporter transmembrane domain-containing protein n=1 Tax=Pisum sativum TaxID=3888 RepID=A0A9D4XXE1_PEA|nr:hypothetical protein KIW84_031985 [Pisum sativum]
MIPEDQLPQPESLPNCNPLPCSEQLEDSHIRDIKPHMNLPITFGLLQSSPQDQGWRQHSHKLRSPARVEQLLEDQARHHDHRDCTPNLVEGSHLDQTRKDVHDETSCKNSECDKQNSPNSCKSDEDKNIQRESSFSVTESRGERNVQKKNKSSEKDISDSQPVEEQKSCSPTIDLKESPYLEPQPPPNEFLSMEEDMDICDTRPHVPVVTNLSSGKWFYLDYGGVENGPAKLCDIKFFVDEGLIVCASNIYCTNDNLDKRTWTYIFGVCCATTVFIPSSHNYRIWSFLGLGMITYTAWYLTIAAIVHGQAENVTHSGPKKLVLYFIGATNIPYTFDGHAATVEIMHAMWKPPLLYPFVEPV